MFEVGPLELLDIGLATAALYAVVVWLKRARAGLAVLGALLLALVYVVARELGLDLTAWLFQGVFAVFFIVLLIVLQHDLRRLFEGVASWGVGRRAPASEARVVDTLCDTVFELASRKCGALIVLPGRDPVERYIEGGEALDGRVGRSLLLSLFDPGSVGHDGAVMIEGDRVAQFAAHLPLSSNFGQIESRGTRHSAALGLSEATDALCVAVSEERGEVSLARDGLLRLIETSDELREEVDGFLAEKTDRDGSPRRGWRILRETWSDAVLALLLAVGAWYVFVSGEQTSVRTVTAPVLVDNIAPGFEVESVDPERLEVELTGLRRDLFLLESGAVEVRLDASLVALGRRTFQVEADDVKTPPELAVRAIEPREVRISVSEVETQEQNADSDSALSP